jgi:hypothetical protein
METYLIIFLTLLASAACGLSNNPAEIGAEEEQYQAKQKR